MMATEYTPNYNLDLYVSTDKPNLLDQYNAAMGKIDAQMKKSADDVTNANANVLTLQVQMTEAQKDITALESTVEAHGTQITGVRKTADDALSLAQTHESGIAGAQSDVAALTLRVTAVEGTAGQNKSDVASLDTRMGVAEGDITGAQSDISSLKTGKAPTNHASAANTYGQGSPTNFGHLKVVDSGTAAASTGTAASPKMVSDAVNVAPTVLTTESISFEGMTEKLSVSVILNEKANMYCISLAEAQVHTSGPIDRTLYLNYKIPERYRPSRKMRAALSVTSAKVTAGMNATVDTGGRIGISFGAPEAISSGYPVGGTAIFIYGLS